MSDFNEYLAEQLKDEEFKKEYEALEPEFAIIQALIDARKRIGITQKELSYVQELHKLTSASLKMVMPILQ